MERQEVLERLKVVIDPYTKNKEGVANLTESTDFIKDLKVNSAHLVDIVLDIENEFGIEIDNASMERMLSVKDTVDVILEKLAAQSA